MATLSVLPDSGSSPIYGQNDIMRICAVLVNYFGANDTIACVRQLCREPIDCVCVVDNSVDTNQACMLASAFDSQKKVILLETGENNGFGAGINYALKRISLSDFDAILIINNDTLISEDFVKKISEGACASGLQIAGPRIQHYPNTEKLWSRGSWYNTWCGLVTHNPLPLPGNIFYLTGCCLLIKRSVFETIGLFDEDFFMYGEDVDFCVRASHAGLKTGVIDTAILFHKASASSVNNSFFYERQIVRAHLHLSQHLFTSRSARVLSTCLKTMTLCMRALLRTLRFGNLNALKGLLSGLYNNSTKSSFLR